MQSVRADGTETAFSKVMGRCMHPHPGSSGGVADEGSLGAAAPTSASDVATSMYSDETRTVLPFIFRMKCVVISL